MMMTVTMHVVTVVMVMTNEVCGSGGRVHVSVVSMHVEAVAIQPIHIVMIVTVREVIIRGPEWHFIQIVVTMMVTVMVTVMVVVMVDVMSDQWLHQHRGRTRRMAVHDLNGRRRLEHESARLNSLGRRDVSHHSFAGVNGNRNSSQFTARF
jgi:hypothetical protein